MNDNRRGLLKRHQYINECYITSYAFYNILMTLQKISSIIILPIKYRILDKNTMKLLYNNVRIQILFRYFLQTEKIMFDKWVHPSHEKYGQGP